MTGLAQAFAAWSLELSMAAVALALVVRTGRRRTAINEALHELRRPLQALALSGGVPTGRSGESGGGQESSVRLAAAALDRLDRAVNGGEGEPVREPVRVESLLRSAVGRWRSRIALEGGSLELRWRGGEATVTGDRRELEAAVDNLIVNAIEHGGSEITVDGESGGGKLRIAVADLGSVDGAGRERESAMARLAGRRRHGHGLAVVRRVAAAHGGRFVLRRSGAGTLAVLELPVVAERPPAA